MPKLSFLNARAFDAGLAALAALSAGFVAFAMPESLFSALVETSRLPDLVPAAEPPLGGTARLAAAGAASLLVLAAAWALLTALGRRPSTRKPEAEIEPESEAPRLRRADAHPDAPARRPLLARDLGEPLDLDDFPEAPAEEESAFAEAEHRPLPAFLVPETAEPEPMAKAEPGLDEPEPRWAEAEPEPEPQPQVERQLQAEADPLPLSELAAQLPEAEEETDQSLSQMVNRIEFGLSRKRQALAAADLPPAEESEAEQEKVGHRLRSAINDLQKIASTGG
ncbi:MAG: hypothetical protein WBR13_07400 [Allosphingosinicella sp.]